MAPQLEYVVAHDLRVVGGVVARRAAFEVQAVGLPVGLDRQVATRATGGPRYVAGVAGHAVFPVSPLPRRYLRSPVLGIAVVAAPRDELGPRGLLVVQRVPA